MLVLFVGCLLDMVVARNMFKLGWTRNISDPFDPMALGIVGPHKQVLRVFFFNLFLGVFRVCTGLGYVVCTSRMQGFFVALSWGVFCICYHPICY